MSDNTNGYKQNINWYPGHMTSAKRMMEENISLVDVVVEILDARIPYSSRNPDIDKLAARKYRLLILSKSDLADPSVTNEWIEHFNEMGIKAISADTRSKKDLKDINRLIKEVSKEKLERDKKKGLRPRPIRAMIVGIPNSGKSTFINSVMGKAQAKTGNKPGVTKGKQWIKSGNDLEFLDTPGILWPKFDDVEVGQRLAITGAINDNILPLYDIAAVLIEYLQNNYCNNLDERYKIESDFSPEEYLYEIAKVRNCIKKGGEADTDRAARLLIDDFRSGRLGRISLERIK